MFGTLHKNNMKKTWKLEQKHIFELFIINWRKNKTLWKMGKTIYYLKHLNAALLFVCVFKLF